MNNILLRRSVRKYKEDPISYDILKELCIAGYQAPTAKRQKSMKFVIVDDKLVIEKLSTASQNASFIKDAAAVIAVIGADPATLRTPHMQIQDLAAATENILIAATSYSIGSCWIGITPVPERMAVTKEVLKIKNDDFVFSLISLGYPSEENAFYHMHKEKDEVIYHNEVK